MSGNFFGGQFFGGGFFGALTDTHDGGGNLRRRHYTREEDEELDRQIKKRAEEYKRHKEKLRADIILAMDGPQEAEVLEVVEEHLGDEREALAAPDYEPDLRGLLAEIGALRQIAMMALAEERRRFEEDEQDVEILLLH